MTNKSTKEYVRGFERALMLAYGTNAIWQQPDLVIRRRVLRIIEGRKSTKAKRAK